MFSLICAWTNSWANSGDAGDLGRQRAYHDVTVMGISVAADSLVLDVRQDELGEPDDGDDEGSERHGTQMVADK